MKRSTIGLAVLAAICTWTWVSTAQADGHDECGYCAAVEMVAEAARCDGCKEADDACASCDKLAKTIMKTAACGGCAEAKDTSACTGCAKHAARLDNAKCNFCAAKKLVASKVTCCTKCAGAGADHVAQCGGCKDVKKAVMALQCGACAAKPSK
jgi:hypothetical protein